MMPRVVLSLARKFAGGDRTEQDLIQEGMLAYMKAEKTFDANAGAKFETYASRVITNRFIDLIRRAPAGTSQINDDTFGNGTDFDNEIKVIEIKKVLKENVCEVERAIFYGYIEGLTYEEISKIFELPRKKIDNIVQKVKKIIKERV